MKALIAVEHSMLTTILHMLTTGEIYRAPAPTTCTRHQPLRSKDRALRRLEAPVTTSPLSRNSRQGNPHASLSTPDRALTPPNFRVRTKVASGYDIEGTDPPVVLPRPGVTFIWISIGSSRSPGW
jgi:hypothetical protein